MEMLRAQGDAALVDGYFANARTYVIAGPKQYDRIPPQALLARSFTTLDGVEADCAEQGTRHVEGLAEALNRGIDARVRAILYDNEHWCLTPIEEQRRHGEYEGKVASAVHAHSLLLIAAPATDLVRTFEPDFAGSVYPEFLRLGILADAARTADVVEVQAQGSQSNLEQYVWFVTEAASQAHQANPEVRVFAGVSTNPSSGVPTSFALCNAIVKTRPVVDGYWLNIPAKGAACPRCGEPRPDIALALLRQLRAGHCDQGVTP